MHDDFIRAYRVLRKYRTLFDTKKKKENIGLEEEEEYLFLIFSV